MSSSSFERTLNEAETFPEAIGEIVAPWRYLLVEHDFALGCPLAATVVDAVTANPDLRVHVSELLARYQATVASVYVKFGDRPRKRPSIRRCCLPRLRAPSSLPVHAAKSSRSTQSSGTSRLELRTRRRRRPSGFRGEA
jgi:hypothetical protein